MKPRKPVKTMRPTKPVPTVFTRDVWFDGKRELIRCPECGNVADLENYDVLGADDGCVFCNQCCTEIRLP